MQGQEMSTKNARTLGIRLDETDATLLKRYEDETTMEGVGLARAALKAALRYYQAHGEITVPLQVVPTSKRTRIPEYLQETTLPPESQPEPPTPIQYPRGSRGKKAS
jgi:hypothetical protein